MWVVCIVVALLHFAAAWLAWPEYLFLVFAGVGLFWFWLSKDAFEFEQRMKKMDKEFEHLHSKFHESFNAFLKREEERKNNDRG